MPRRAARVCSQPGCPNLVTKRDRRFCDEHQAQEWKRQDARRGTSAQRGYGPRWQKIRARYIKAHPVCERCQRAQSVLVHHIVRKRDGGTDDPDNLLALCRSCHAQIHSDAGELGGKGRQNR